MKKTIKLAGISALAVLGVASLASCGGSNNDDTTSASTKLAIGGQLDISLNYQVKKVGQTGLSYNGEGTRALKYANITLSSGDMLPTWTCLEGKLNTVYSSEKTSTITFKDGNPYDQTDYKKDFTQHWVNGFTDKSGNKLDLVMGGGTYYTQYANDGKLLAIDEHLDQMPNFKAWVEQNEDIWNSMKHTDGHVYFTPYFDGLNSIEKMLLMNTKYVEKLLDGTIDSEDATVTLADTSYDVYVKETEKQKLTVSVDGKAKTITADFSEANNAVYKQNHLDQKNGKTLVEALKAALIAEYGSAIAESAGGSAKGNDVVYNKLSEIFTGEKACYNTDDLVALLRCVKTCPKTLTGDVSTTMNPISPRTAENKRTIDLVSLISLWGLKGNDSENGKLYYDVNGELKDGRTTEDTYNVGLENLHKLYQEGLFVQNFTTDPGKKEMGSTEWRSTNIKNGTGFLYYDYNGTTSPFNDDVAADSKGFAQPILAPVVKWQADSSKTLNYKGENLAGKYFRYSEANRALKDGGWCIPATSDNPGTALALMDYLFSTDGARIQDYGPDNEAYWDLKNSTDAGISANDKAICDINGGSSPIINSKMLEDIKGNGEGVTWNDYYRAFIGSTQGIGHIREDSLDYQTTYSDKSRAGLSNIQTAIKSGAMILAQTTISSDTSKFFVSVPQTIAISSDDTSKINSSTENTKLKEVWDSSSSDVICPAINWILIGDQAITSTQKYASKDQMIGTFNTIDSVFLEAYSKGAKKIIK